MEICVIENCSAPVHLKREGWCRRHYYIAWRHGSPHYVSRVPEHYTVQQRLEYFGWDEVSGGCWEWRARRTPDGYGQFKMDRTQKWAHREAYKEWVGPIPAGMVICHKCDNPPCINPEHLFVGTQADNVADMRSKGRGRVRRSLTHEQALEIKFRYRAGGISQKELEKEYGLSSGSVSRLMTGKTYPEIP